MPQDLGLGGAAKCICALHLYLYLYFSCVDILPPFIFVFLICICVCICISIAQEERETQCQKMQAHIALPGRRIGHLGITDNPCIYRKEIGFISPSTFTVESFCICIYID